MTVPIIILFGAYTVGSYGWILLKGYNITFKDWVNPLNPYRWPGGTPGLVPAGQVFPSKASATSAATTAVV